MGLKVVPVFGSILFVMACSAEADMHNMTLESDPVFQYCQAMGHDELACSCVSREAHTRFSHDDLRRVVTLGQLSLAEHLENSELSSTERTALLQRIQNASIVIRQTCGAELIPEDALGNER